MQLPSLYTLCSLSLLAVTAMSQVTEAQEQKSACQFSTTSDQKHTFGLASLAKEGREALSREELYKQAAEACYEGCNSAEIMSFSSSYWKQKTAMTILDRETDYLIDSGFFGMNESYLVNHISITNEGATGLGCFQLQSESQFALYPLDHPTCKTAKSVVCGMTVAPKVVNTGQNTEAKPIVSPVEQQGATATATANPSNDQIVNPDKDHIQTVNGTSSGDTVSDDHHTSIAYEEQLVSAATTSVAVSTASASPSVSASASVSVSATASASEMAKDTDIHSVDKTTVPGVTTEGNDLTNDISDDDSQISNQPMTTNNVNKNNGYNTYDTNENDLVYPLSVGDIQYRVIRLPTPHNTMEAASALCNIHRDKIGSLYATTLPTFSNWFQRVHPTGKTIISSWNGDSYGASTTHCLLYSASQGIHLGSCSDASVLLCENAF